MWVGQAVAWRPSWRLDCIKRLVNCCSYAIKGDWRDGRVWRQKPVSECGQWDVWRQTPRLEVMAPNRPEVVEDPHSERDYRGDRKVHAQLVAEIGQAPGQGHVREQPAEEDARLERARDVCLERTEDRVERSWQCDRGVTGIGDRDGDGRKQTEDHADDREHDRDDDYLQALGEGVGPGEGET